ncbi:MAG TPA: hypothetical protein VM576_08290 [Xanthomonadaceae bacterium]|nr:hypothetical protein [Xanthomonadaceae bacterium]
MNARLAFASFLLVLPLAACGDRDAGDAAAAAQAPAQDEALPRPDADAGAVTGMPAKPGPGPIGPPTPPEVEGEPVLPPETIPDAMLAEDGAVASTATNAAQPAGQTTASAGPAAPEPTPDDAVAVVRDYYAALAVGDFARARSLWSEGGAASGHSAQELAERYAGTVALTVDTGAPGRVDPAAGSRYIKVPVNITRTLADGGVQRSTGIVALRRSVVDGATAEQRAWRIAWAELRTASTP